MSRKKGEATEDAKEVATPPIPPARAILAAQAAQKQQAPGQPVEPPAVEIYTTTVSEEVDAILAAEQAEGPLEGAIIPYHRLRRMIITNPLPGRIAQPRDDGGAIFDMSQSATVHRAWIMPTATSGNVMAVIWEDDDGNIKGVTTAINLS